jgi:DNA-binding HxlR family transcriptional regulator
MVRAYRTFKEFQEAGEGIATNVLADRLRKLEAGGIIMVEADENDGRRLNYRLTEKGIDLAPVMLELLVWASRHEETAAPCAVIENMAKNREAVLAETRRRWLERDPTPLLPRFDANR